MKLAVFDLDSTIFNVTKRNEQIIKDFTAENLFQKKYPIESEKLKAIITEHNDWGIEKAVQRLGLSLEAPFFRELKNYWKTHFFSNPYLKYDFPYDGAVEYVKRKKDSGFTISYLTGRDRPRMQVGTIESLKQWELPAGSPLCMKPDSKIKDELFKVNILKQWSKNYQEIHFYENEPVIINRTLERLPQIKVIFMDTVHSGREEVTANIQRVTSFS